MRLSVLSSSKKAWRSVTLTSQRISAFVERIGVNLGDVIVEGEDRHGDGVNVAARLQQVAEAGGICVSRTVAETVKHKLSLQFELLGEHRVKNIAEPVSMYRVVLDGKAARPRPLRWPIPRFGRWSFAAATAFVLAIIAAAVAWNGYWREPACALAPEKPSIAVLPFDYVGEDPKRSRIADGLSEDVIGNLSRLGDLFVIAGNSTRIYKGGGIDVAEVGCDLGVTYVLQGSLARLWGQDFSSSHSWSRPPTSALSGRRLSTEAQMMSSASRTN